MEHGVRLTLAYDGTDFAGYQCQPETRTVQSVLESAVEQVTQHSLRVRSCSRTDAGVHAEAQIVAFSTSRLLAPRRWVLALNRYLPDDVAVRDAVPCEPGYEPRFDALDKTYRYLFHLGFARSPLLRTRAWHLGRDAHALEGADLSRTRADYDLDSMQKVCELFVGTHDFRAFKSSDDIRDNRIRTLHRVELIRDFHGDPNVLALEICGTAFMKNMVRVIAGTLVTHARGKISHAEIAELLTGKIDRHALCETAPGHGLTLVKVTLGRMAAQASRSAP